MKKALRNEQIQSSAVSFVGAEAQARPRVMPTEEALAEARAQGLDLVVVDGRQDPPVCRAFDYKKQQFEKKKRQKPKRPPPMKELRIHPTTASHDLEVKARKARALLEKGHAVKLAVRMKGRENAFAGQASEKLGALAEGVCGENRRGEMKRSGREISCVLEP